MRNLQLKIFLLILTPFLSQGNVFAQQAPAKSPSAADVVEVETEIGVEQMQPSNRIEKTTIKPRSDYKPRKTAAPRTKEKMLSVQEETSSVIARSSEGATKSQRDSLRSQSQPEIASSSSAGTLDDDSLTDAVSPPAQTITDDQVVEMSASLRKLIDDNNKLKSQIAELDGQLKIVRGQQKLESNRVNEVVLERDALKKQNENIVSLGSEAQKRLEALQAELTQKEQDYSLQIVRLQTELAQKLRNSAAEQPLEAGNDALPPALEETPPISEGRGVLPRAQGSSVSVDVVSAPTAQDAQQRGQKILLALDAMTEQKNKIAVDEAKVHYNMGNTYFNQGAYDKAAKEYARSLDLSPHDASAHYNLAFVSGEFLNDPQTAIGHYKKYLFLNPNAEDAQMIQQKIIEAEILVKGDVPFESDLNEELRAKKNDANAMLAE